MYSNEKMYDLDNTDALIPASGWFALYEFGCGKDEFMYEWVPVLAIEAPNESCEDLVRPKVAVIMNGESVRICDNHLALIFDPLAKGVERTATPEEFRKYVERINRYEV